MLDAIIKLLGVENKHGVAPIRVAYALRTREAKNGGVIKPRALLKSAEDLTTRLRIEKSIWEKWTWTETVFGATTMFDSDKNVDMKDAGQLPISTRSTDPRPAASAATSNITNSVKPAKRESDTDEDSKHRISEHFSIHKLTKTV
jgi:hypothetical protein